MIHPRRLNRRISLFCSFFRPAPIELSAGSRQIFAAPPAEALLPTGSFHKGQPIAIGSAAED
jgi:hypothetical protein